MPDSLLLPLAVITRAAFAVDAVSARLQRGVGELAGRLGGALGPNHPAAGFLAELGASAAAADSDVTDAAHPVDRLAAALRLTDAEIDLLLLAALPEEHEGLAAVLRDLHPDAASHATAGLAAVLAEHGLLPGLPAGPAGRRAVRGLLADSALVRSRAVTLGPGPFWDRSLQLATGLWSALHGEPGWPVGVRELPRREAATAPAGADAAVRAVVRGARVLVCVHAADGGSAAAQFAQLLERAGTAAAPLALAAEVEQLPAAAWLAALCRGQVPVFLAGAAAQWPDLPAPLVLVAPPEASEAPLPGRPVLDVNMPGNSAAERAAAVPQGGTRVVPSATWSDLVLPAAALEQLQEAVARVQHADLVLGEWGFLAGRPGRRGVRLLFCGPPGTGKTLAAEVLAGAVGRELLVVDLSRTVSKWIGETEKNLAAAFDAAERGDYVLLFDEADALFARRTEVGDARDRYANLETSYLLSRLSWFDGVAVLATNLRQNLDIAFGRRLEFVIPFNMPDVDERRALWAAHLPARAPVDADVDLDQLAAFYPISGALIRNAAIGAAYLAAADARPIGTAHLVHAVRREYLKAGLAYPGPLPDHTGPAKEQPCQ